MDIISINNIIFSILGYNISLIELIGVVTGLISVWYAVKVNALTWSLGIVNALAFLIIFYQINLYSSMMLQLYFIIISVIGLFKWNKKYDLKITKYKKIGLLSLYILLSSTVLYFFIANIHIIFPNYFTAAQYPMIDSIITVSSIFASSLMAMKKIESWILWILIDIVSIFLYLSQGTLFLSIEYVVFLILSIIGYLQWKKNITYE